MTSFRRILSLDDPDVAPFVALTERQLRSDRGLFVAESPKVIMAALDRGLRPVALLAEERHLRGDARQVIDRCQDMKVLTGSRELLSRLTGYTLTRGVLCAMERPALLAVADIIGGKRRVAVIHGVSDTTNVGSIFRSAAALGIDAVLVTPQTCDPLNRRSVRVSMGTVFKVPWTVTGSDMEEVRDAGFKIAAMALEEDSVAPDAPVLKGERHLAILLGEEGYGLPAHIIERSDYKVCIPMYHEVDSLNVGAAAAVAFWELCK